MTPSIFFDLETTDTEPIGQILNFSFILIDADWHPISECGGRIRISRLELPRASAILANRVDVQKHQKEAEYSEYSAMLAIEKYFQSIVSKHGDYKVPLIGFNSSKFDLRFLRTSLIRNGVDPYFKVINRDLLFLARKLAISNPSFPRVSQAEEGKLSLRLETLATIHGALVGKQSHDSREDVLLTIRLAKLFLEKYGLDVRTFEAYEAKNIRPGSVAFRAEPNYELKGERAIGTPMALLDSDNRYALWVNLNQYREQVEAGGDPKKSVWWFKFDGKEFYLGNGDISPYKDLASKALKDLKGITLRNYFSPKTCDVELDITRLDREQIRALRESYSGKALNTANADTKKVAARFKLSNYVYGSGHDEQMEKLLAGYASYRYGGKFGLDRKQTDSRGELKECFGPSLPDLISEVYGALKGCKKGDKDLLESLLQFYKDSDIFRVTGTKIDCIEAA